MKSRKSALSLILAILLGAGTVLPAAAAEPAENDAFMETEVFPETDITDAEEITDEKQDAEEAAEEEILPEEGDGAADFEEEREAEIPDVRNASSDLDQNGTSVWLSDYSYEIKDGRLILKDYLGTGTEVTVPGSAYVRNTLYDKVYLTAKMWGDYVTSLAFEKGVTLPEDSSYMFAPKDAHDTALAYFNGENLDTSAVTEMNNMFYTCSALTELNLSGFDTSSVTTMSSMFHSCRALTELDLSSFDTSSVTEMYSMFVDCIALTELDLSSFDTSSVRSFFCMFAGCSALTGLDMSGFNTSSATVMSNMFYNCSALTELDLSGFDTSSVTGMSSMFYNCRSLTVLDLGSFDTSAVVNIYHMFYDCRSLTSLDVSSFNLSSATDLSGMFYNCSSLTELDVSSFNTSAVTNLSGMFQYCRSLQELDLSSFNTSAVTSMSQMFFDCESLKELDLTGFDTSAVTSMYQMFSWCNSLKELDLTSFDTSAVTTMYEMFRICSSLQELDLRSFVITPQTTVTNMLSFSSHKSNVKIWTPASLSTEVLLDVFTGKFYSESGEGYSSLPMGSDSLLIVQNGKISFTSQPSSIAVFPGEDAVFTAGIGGMPERGVWQYCDLGESAWTDYMQETDKVKLQKLVIPASPEWDCRAVRLVLYDAWGNTVTSDEAWLTVAGDISECTVSLSESSYVYTGEAIRPVVTVKKGTASLQEGRDYTVSYTNNINAGSAKAVVRGTGCCSGSKEIAFTITKAAQNITLSASKTTISKGETSVLTAAGAAGSVSYTSSRPSVASVSGNGTVTGISAGKTVITATAAETANYTSRSASLVITVTDDEVVSDTKDISLCTVALERSSYPFTGAAIIPGLTVTDEGTLLSEGTDYTVTCSSNRDAGTATVLITGKGSYTGSVTKYFTITRIDQEMEAVISRAQLTAGETAQITVTGNKGDLVFTSSNEAAASVDSAGLVTAISAGDTLITVTAKMTMNYHKAQVEIPVTVAEAAQQETGRSVEEISYSFSNSSSAFSYPSGYKIPLSSYQIIYGDNTRAEMVYAAHSRTVWGGNCAGLAATSALMTTAGGGVWPYTFKTGASLPRDLAASDNSSTLGMDLTTFVEAMHIAQYTDAFSNERKAHVVYTTAIRAGNANLDGLYNAVKSKAESDIPTVLALVQAGGHAVLAYKTEEVGSDESRIYIYDSNFPLQDRYITLYKNGGHYTQWSYDMGSYGVWGTDSSASSISYVAYATLKSIWDSRGNVGKDEASLAFVNSQNFAVYDVKGSLEAIVSDGVLSDRTGKISLIEDELSLTGAGTQEVILSLPTKTHTITNLDKSLSSFAVSVVDTDLGISVDTTVQEITVSVDDEYSVNSLSMDAGTGDTYSVTLSNSFASGYDKVEVNGSGQGETLSISQSGTNLTFNNCDISLLMVDGKQVGVYEITASATEGGSISPSGTTSLRQGESLACTITPDTGYAIQDVFVDNRSVGAVSSYTFENVRGGHTIFAPFKKAPANLAPPEVTSVTNVKGGIKIAWGRVEGAENYRIYYKVNGGGWKRLIETTGTSYTWTGAESGNTYGFTIRCMDAAGTSFTSGYDNTGKSVAYIAAPYVTKLENLAGGVKITWTKSTGAALYRIYYKEGTGGWKRLTETDGTSYTWTGAQSGKTYGFTIRCMNAAGTSFTSGYDDAGKNVTYVKPSEIPEVTALSAVTGGLKIDWSAYPGAGVYAVYYKNGTGAGGWKKLVSVSGTSYTWTGAMGGTTYSFTVRAMNDAGTSFVSGYNNTGMSIAYKALASIPKVTSVTNVQGGVKIAWSAFTGAGSYRIFYKESGGSWKKLADAAGTSYTWTGAVSGSFYAFTVRALNAAGTSYVSGYDNTGRSITYVAAPVITTLKKVSGGIQVSWGACAGAGSYRIFVKINGGGWKKLTDVSGTSYTWKGAAAGNTYGFTVRCMDAGSTGFVSGYDNTGKSLAF